MKIDNNLLYIDYYRKMAAPRKVLGGDRKKMLLGMTTKQLNEYLEPTGMSVEDLKQVSDIIGTGAGGRVILKDVATYVNKNHMRLFPKTVQKKPVIKTVVDKVANTDQTFNMKVKLFVESLINKFGYDKIKWINQEKFQMDMIEQMKDALKDAFQAKLDRVDISFLIFPMCPAQFDNGTSSFLNAVEDQIDPHVKIPKSLWK